MQPAIIQILAYISLTVASLVVAGVSLYLTYRQSVGWSPILLLPRYGLNFNRDLEPGEWIVYFDIEIWNRRKYPLIIRNGHISFESTNVHLEPAPPKNGHLSWQIRNTNVLQLRKQQGFTIEPGSYTTVYASANYRKKCRKFVS